MTNKTQLQINNVALGDYIARVNAAKEVAANLPEAGSGGASIDTCTIQVVPHASKIYGNVWSCCNEVADDGQITIKTVDDQTIGVSSSKCPCNSLIVVKLNYPTQNQLEVFISDSSAKILYDNGYDSAVIQAPSTAGETLTIDVKDD